VTAETKIVDEVVESRSVIIVTNGWSPNVGWLISSFSSVDTAEQAQWARKESDNLLLITVQREGKIN
jgi:hypothetical protein